MFNGTVLNSAISPVNAGTTITRPIAAVAQMSATTFARFTQPPRTNTTALPADSGTVEIVDANTGTPLRSFAALEGPMSQALTNGRATVIDGRTMAVDSSGTTAYVITTTGLSMIPLTPLNPQNGPRVFAKGTVNLASYQTSIAQNGLISIFGTKLGSDAVASSMPLPYILGNTCVTLGNVPLPLFMTSDGQINAQIPPEMATANYNLVVRAIDRNMAGPPQQITVSKYAPAVFVDTVSGQAAILHADGRFVTKDHPANRDEPLVMYAGGLGGTPRRRVLWRRPRQQSRFSSVTPVTSRRKSSSIGAG